MTDEITYHHTSSSSLSFSCKPSIGWADEKTIAKQEGRMGISNDPNKCLRRIPFNSYISVANILTLHTYMMPDETIDYCATSDIDGFVFDDGGVETDDTADANDVGPSDCPLLPNIPEVNDAVYFGMSCILSMFKIKIGQSGNWTGTITWEYSTGSDGWAALEDVDDGTDSFEAVAGDYYVSWTIPPDWATDEVGSITDLYWVRARVSAYTGLVTRPLATQMWLMGKYPYVSIALNSSTTWLFPCQLQKPTVTKSNDLKYAISATIEERTR